MKKTRREFIKRSAMVALGTFAVSKIPGSVINGLEKAGDDKTVFTLPKLDHPYDAFEPFIDARTMEIHHSKHHQAYVDKLNKALAVAKITGVSLVDLIKNCSTYSVGVRNNGGAHWNHSFFWKLMQPPLTISVLPKSTLNPAIATAFGTMDDFKSKFSDAAKGVFGSGWVWLVVNKDKKLEIGTTPNQDNPLMDVSPFKGTPVLALDVWEHAYYLKHMNMRADYINDWWNLVNWEKAAFYYQQAIR